MPPHGALGSHEIASQPFAGKLVSMPFLCKGSGRPTLSCYGRVHRTAGLSWDACMRRRINNRASARRVRQKREEDLQKITTLVSPLCLELDMSIKSIAAQTIASLHRCSSPTVWQPVSCELNIRWLTH